MITTSILLPDPARRLWPLVRWDGRLCDWYPGAVALTVEGTGKGALRQLLLKDGTRLVQRLEHTSRIDEAYTYAVVESPYPVADLLAQIRVQPEADGHATLIWTATFKPTGLSEARTELFVRDLYDAGVERLRGLLTR
ncbi:SRPBCC family protein [Azospirillum doebereinerae]|uniref:SRPBCC family protein n=1 Tax=Azospirillum doebereinerae TaxID=92933 RepID=A0A3S0XMX0_9PROT|nr:SRPBCC family protein [Azospirillum doebereinerae]MCG5242395.1 SRPBCC family protein [Azospirillum doebereinerae]RUQ71364.1 SRPBCC family protein [Azospirillum doebereinerae]